MWTPTPDYDIIVETLTGSEFEVTVRETDTIGYLKYRIKKYEGIPVNQQHILFQQKELKDATVLKDIPLVRGSRLTLVLGMRGGPISARRVVTDCDNWYDLSDVLNSANRGQLTPIEPLTISTTGVKVLLYKDCKKNINRLMKLRKHHLHSHGTGTHGTSSSMTGNSIKCSSSSSAAAAAGRTQLKFLDKHAATTTSPDDNAAVDAQDQQWLLDNIATLKKMKQLRQSMEAKKKKKHRPSDPYPADTLTQNLKELELELQMNEKLQKWLHRVASNTTHLSDADLPSNSSSLATTAAATVATTGPAGVATVSCSSSPLNLFDRVRRKPASSGLASSPRQQEAMMSFTARGGARKKESYPTMDRCVAYSMSMEEFCMIAKDYETAAEKKSGATTAAAAIGSSVKQETSSTVTSGVYDLPKLLIREDSPIETGGASITATKQTATAAIGATTTSMKSTANTAGGDEDERGGMVATESERLKKRRESSQFEERLLTQFYDNSSPQCENFFRAFATTSDGASSFLKESGASALNKCGGGGGERVSKFKWRFHGGGGGGGDGGGDHSSGNSVSSGVVAGGTSPGATEADIFLNSLLLKRNKNSKIQKFTKLNFDHSGCAYGGTVAAAATKRWTDEEVEQVIRGSSSSRAEEENVIEVRKQKPSEEVAKATVIDLLGEEEREVKFKENDGEGATAPACTEELLDEEEYRQFLDEGQEHLARLRENYKLLDMMTFDSSESDSCGEISILKGDGYFDLDNAADEGTNDENGDYEEEEEDEDDEVEVEAEEEEDDDDDGYDDEDEENSDGGLQSAESDALEFDDFAYFPSTSFRSSFRKQSATLRPVLDDDEEIDPMLICPNHHNHHGTSFLPRIDHLEQRTSSPLELRGADGEEEEDADDDGEEEVEVVRDFTTTEVLRRPPRIGPGERLLGPSLPAINGQGAATTTAAAEERRRERIKFESSMFGEPATPTTLSRPPTEEFALKRERASVLPDIKLLESDLKRMGLDVILNDDSDESFERTIKRHFRSDQSKAAANVAAHTTTTTTTNKCGEVLLRTGNEGRDRDQQQYQKKLKQEISMDLIQWEELPDPRTIEEKKLKLGNRCAKCNKKLGLIMIMKCHCGLLFCAQHRYAEAHNCTYDFKEEGKRILAKENPLVVGEKLPKI